MLSGHSTVQSFLAGLSPQRAWFDCRPIHVGYKWWTNWKWNIFPYTHFFCRQLPFHRFSIFIYVSFKGMEHVSFVSRCSTGTHSHGCTITTGFILRSYERIPLPRSMTHEEPQHPVQLLAGM